ncbi:Merlin:moesin:ezrin:radixin [Fasciolopsis buskii]|uniref:Merlin:moesin:ezrin:radixin n=1 Tax=Fasciolopsis buskii TaxID=27845 RepID=A0A8E0VIN7_9TREM|nr:Merlin:moesin:ezrin:radixin [Fasciolopsis buski]
MRLSQWLKLDKKIVSQRSNAAQKQLCFFFHTKFFPEDIEQELIQATTRHLFYLSVKATILNRNETDFNGTFSGRSTVGHRVILLKLFYSNRYYCLPRRLPDYITISLAGIVMYRSRRINHRILVFTLFLTIVLIPFCPADISF